MTRLCRSSIPLILLASAVHAQLRLPDLQRQQQQRNDAIIAGIAVGTDTRRAPADFPVQVSFADGKGQLAAEFMVRLISYQRESFVTDNFLVVEVAAFPAKGQEIALHATAFSLRINGAKVAIPPQTPGMVAASIRYPDWERPPTEASVGVGDGQIRVGGQQTERFPGDRRVPQGRIPGTTTDGDPDAAPQVEQRLSAFEVVSKAALPEGARKSTYSGYLYFYWKGNPTKLKTVDLLFAGVEPAITLKLR